MDQKPEDENNYSNGSSLENESPVVAAPTENSAEAQTDATNGHQTREARHRRNFMDRLAGTNIYLLAFCLILLVVGGGLAFGYVHSHQQKQSSDALSSQSLSTSDLDQLANSGVSVGDAKQVLTVQSNAIFSNKVLVRSDLEVAGKIIVGSSLSLTGITVSGQSTFDDVQVTKNVSVSGNTAVQGKLTANSIATTGSGSFGGPVSASQLSTNALILNGDLTLTHHFVIGGATPGRANGGALGSGGTSSVSGSDTAGSISINTGSSPSAGCFVSVNFTQKYNSTPHVLITPVGSGAALVNFYVTRSSTSFSVCGTNAAGAGQSFGFDYFVTQ